MKKLLLIVFALSAVSGCTTMSGPYVTNVASDGKDGLIVDKCMVSFDGFWGIISTTNCSSQTIPLKVKPASPSASALSSVGETL